MFFSGLKVVLAEPTGWARTSSGVPHYWIVDPKDRNIKLQLATMPGRRLDACEVQSGPPPALRSWARLAAERRRGT